MKENELRARAEQLLLIINEPEKFLARQRELLYGDPTQISGAEVNRIGLPRYTEKFYAGRKIG